MSENKTPRRDFIKLATMTLGGVGAASLAIPFITSMNPGKDTLALASTEIDLSPLKEGQSLTVIWRGKPVFIKHRTPKEITEAKNTDLNDLIDKTHFDYEENEAKAKQLEERILRVLECLKVIFLREHTVNNLKATNLV